MPDRLHVLVDSQPLIAELRGDDVVIGDGQPTRVTELGDGRFRIEGGGGAWTAVAAVAGDRIWVAVGDETFDCRVSAHSPAHGTTRSDNALAAPMPATVTAVPVRVGQTVEAGELLIALEAMKMELPLRAPHRAVVSAVHCAVGDMVQPDVVLVELRPEPPPADRA